MAEGLPCLNTPEELVLYSIDGREEREDVSSSDEQFHGYPILGKLQVKQATARAAIIAAIKGGVAQSDGSAAACFWPRHGIHVVENGESADYVICFECSQMAIYHRENKDSAPTTSYPQSVLDGYLEGAGIPLAPK